MWIYQPQLIIESLFAEELVALSLLQMPIWKDLIIQSIPIAEVKFAILPFIHGDLVILMRENDSDPVNLSPPQFVWPSGGCSPVRLVHNLCPK